MVNGRIRDNIDSIRERMEKTAGHSGRKPEEILLMAVTKTVSVEDIGTAAGCGIRLFGENRVQEAREKSSAFPAGSELHLIGHLQRNKAPAAAELFSTVQSIDKSETALSLSKELSKRGRHADILLEVNTSGEENKHGVRTWDDLLFLIDEIMKYPELTIRGLMTVGPLTNDTGRIRDAFRSLRKTSERLSMKFRDLDFSIVSMGMSSDYEIAIEEGSTLVRIGTGIFGQR